eukprot:13142955-Heterocapsa_arctica.AAC.1
MGVGSWGSPCVICPGTASAAPLASSMAAPRPSASSLNLSAMGSMSASLFSQPGFVCSATGPRVSGPAFGLWALPGTPSDLGPVACDPALPGGWPWGVTGAALAAGSAFGPEPFGASAALWLHP